MAPTEKDRATQAQAGLMRTGLDLIPQALSIFDSDLRLAVCNRRYQEMFDLEPAYVTAGVGFEDTIRYLVQRGEYGEIDDEEEAVRGRVVAARAFVPHYLERQRPNGTWLSVEGFPLPQGGWVTVYTDITEVRVQQQMLRARSAELSEQLLSNTERLSVTNRQLQAANTALSTAQSELTEIAARARLTTEMMPAHIAHVDRSLDYTFTNRRLPSVIPGTPAQIIGQHIKSVLGSDTFNVIHENLLGALEGKESVREFTDGVSGRRIRSAFTPDQVAGGPINGVYILSMDITQETQSRAIVTQTRKRELAAQLTSGLAHDFANLLTIILGLQQRMMKHDLPPEVRDYVGSTVAAARRGGTLLDRIAAISGKRKIQPVAVHMPEFLKDLSIMAEAALPEGITFETAIRGIDRPLLLDRDTLQDSLLNLILNARDAIVDHAGKAGGRIRLEVAPVHDTWVELRITDTGGGFSADALGSAFDPFFTTKGGEGSGLGLSMVFDQTSLLGGTVWLQNQATGGAKVSIRLPYREAPPAMTGGLVLLVDDSDDIRESVREMLRGMGHTVIEASSAEEAETLAALPDIDLVLTDLKLRGGRSGLDLADGLRAAGLGPTGIMTSAAPADPLRAEAASRYALLPKPFDAATLARFLPTVNG